MSERHLTERFPVSRPMRQFLQEVAEAGDRTYIEEALIQLSHLLSSKDNRDKRIAVRELVRMVQVNQRDELAGLAAEYFGSEEPRGTLQTPDCIESMDASVPSAQAG